MSAADEFDGLVLSRSHAAGSANARGLLFTVLGECLLPNGGSAWTSSLIELLAGLGVEQKATRQALARTAADGWLSSRRDGRRTRWALTPAGDRLLTDGARRIYSFAGPDDSWDGRWLLVSARLPDSDRPGRHLLRSRLAWAGFGSLAPGLWISSHCDRLDELTGVLDEAGCTKTSQVFVATGPEVGDVAEMVRQAWDLDAVEAEYRYFIGQFSRVDAVDPLRATVQLVHAWRRFPAVDPALPRQLLPSRWSGVAAAELFRERHERWSAPARQRWLELEAAG